MRRERDEERKHFESVLRAFDSYLPMMLAANENRKRSYKALSPHHRALLDDLGPGMPAPILEASTATASNNAVPTGRGVRARIDEIDDRIRRNADVLSRIVADSRQFIQAAGQYMASGTPAASSDTASSTTSPSSDETEAASIGHPSGTVSAPPLRAAGDDPSNALASPMQSISVSAASSTSGPSGTTEQSQAGASSAAERRERRKRLAAEKERQQEAEQEAHHHEKVRSTIKQFVRDWSKDGKAERDAAYQPIIEAVNVRFGHLSGLQKTNVNILVPGAGLGRLAWEFAHRGYNSQGNEFSFYMLVASHFVLNETTAVDEHVLYPYIHSASNWRSARDMLQPVLIPDVMTCDLPDGVDFSMVAGEFVEVYGRPAERERWQCVATSFFLDTARNPVQYLEVIHSVLELGGYWINAGPLLWHFENGPGEMSIELTLEEVMALVRKMGFEVEEERMLEPQMYTGAPRAMLTYEYTPALFVARKVRRTPAQ